MKECILNDYRRCTLGIPEDCGETLWEFQGGNRHLGKRFEHWENFARNLEHLGETVAHTATTLGKLLNELWELDKATSFAET